MWGIPWLVEELSACQEGLCCMVLAGESRTFRSFYTFMSPIPSLHIHNVSQFLLLNLTEYVFIFQAIDEFTIGTFQTDDADIQELENEDYDHDETSENKTSQHQEWEDGVIN